MKAGEQKRSTVLNAIEYSWRIVIFMQLFLKKNAQKPTQTFYFIQNSEFPHKLYSCYFRFSLRSVLLDAQIAVEAKRTFSLLSTKKIETAFPKQSSLY